MMGGWADGWLCLTGGWTAVSDRQMNVLRERVGGKGVRGDNGSTSLRLELLYAGIVLMVFHELMWDFVVYDMRGMM